MDLFERKVKSSQFMNHPEKGKEVVIPKKLHNEWFWSTREIFNSYC